ncbi:MAG: hypothetical protein QXW19_04280 [Candidatus Bathyarchaeia archaeon]
MRVDFISGWGMALDERVVSREEWGAIQVRLLFLSAELAAYEVLGERAKEFLEAFYKRATKSWLCIMEREYGIRPKRAKTALEALENYIGVGIAGWLFRSRADFDLEDLGDRIRVKVHRCPFVKHCLDMLENPPLVGPSGFELKMGKELLTCPRIGCFRAAVEELTDLECRYELRNLDPPRICEGDIIILGRRGRASEKRSSGGFI